MNISRPLENKNIIVTRASDQAGVLSAMLRERGATVIEFPTIEVVPPATWAELDDALKTINEFQWILFTSANAVKFFVQRIESLGKNVRVLDGMHICAVGPKTAESLHNHGIHTDMVPADFRSEGVVELFRTRDMKGKKVLIPRAKEAREIIPDALKQQGAQVTVVPVYENVKPVVDQAKIRDLFTKGKIDVITFTSASTVRNFVEIVGQKEYKTLVQNATMACIGPITAQTLERYGMKKDIMPADYTIEALVQAIVDYF